MPDEAHIRIRISEGRQLGEQGVSRFDLAGLGPDRRFKGGKDRVWPEEVPALRRALEDFVIIFGVQKRVHLLAAKIEAVGVEPKRFVEARRETVPLADKPAQLSEQDMAVGPER